MKRFIGALPVSGHLALFSMGFAGVWLHQRLSICHADFLPSYPLSRAYITPLAETGLSIAEWDQ